MDDILIHYGDEVKALGNGRVGGYLVRFSDHTEKDFYGDYFDAKGYYGPKNGDGAETLFDHGFPVVPDDTKGLDANTIETLEALADYTFQPVKTKRDAIGIWAETVLDMANKYEKMVYDLCEQKKLGWSSGSSGHRVKRESGGKIVRWPISEGSLTPCPADKRNYGKTIPVKSLAALARVDFAFTDEPETKSIKKTTSITGSLSDRLTRYITDLVDDGTDRDVLIKRLARESMMDVPEVEKVLTGEFRRPSNARLKAFGRVLDLPFDMLRNLADRSAPKSIKDLFTEELEGRVPSTYELESAYRCVVKKIAEAASSAKAVGGEYDYAAQVTEATIAYLDMLKGAVLGQIEAYVDSDRMDDFYLKATPLSQDDFYSFSKGTDLEDHSQLVVTAVRDIAARFRANHEARKTQKAGRVLSEKNRTRLTKLVEQMMTAVTECQGLLEETKPMASDMEKRAAITRHLKLKHERRQPVGVN